MTQDTSLEQNVSQVKQCLSNIAQNLPNFKARPTQEEMIQRVLEVLMQSQDFDKRNTEQLLVDDIPLSQTGEAILAVEGPTGTGKRSACGNALGR